MMNTVRKMREQRNSYRRFSNDSERTNGFLLVAVLFCLLIAGLTLVSLTRRSLTLVSTAAVETDRLQQRWGSRTIQNVILNHAEELFDARDETMKEAGDPLPYPTAMRADFVLGEHQYQILISDEGAKANLNLLASTKPNSMNQLLKNIVPTNAQPALRLRPFDRNSTERNGRPQKSRRRFTSGEDADEDDSEEGQDDLERVFGSWSQVFDLQRIQGGKDALPLLTQSLTCWGPGRLNVTRVDAEMAIQYGGEFVSRTVVRKILQEWWKEPRLSLPRLMESRGNLSGTDIAKLQDLFVTTSSSFSVSVGSRSKHSIGRRFAVMETDADGVRKTIEFLY